MEQVSERTRREVDLHRALGLPRQGENYRALCPYHDDTNNPSLGIWRDHAYCFRCGVWKSTEDFLDDLQSGRIGTLDLAAARPSRNREDTPRYLPRSLADAYAALLQGPLAHRQVWLIDRGLRAETIRQHQLGHTGSAFVIPILDRATGLGDAGRGAGQASRGGAEPTGGALTGLRFRRDDAIVGSEGPKYWGLRGHNDAVLYDPAAVLWDGGTRVQDNSKRVHRVPDVCLCEGELDALLLVQEGLPAVSAINGTSGLKREMVPLFDGAQRIYLCGDQDEAGRAKTAKLASWFGGRARRVTWDDAKDVTDFIKLRGFPAFKQRMEMCGRLHAG